MDILLWIVAILLVLVGIAGTVLPMLPGVPIVFGGLLLAAWIDGFAHVGWPVLLALGVLTVVSLIADAAAASLGAKRAGAGRAAAVGAAIGTLVGLFFGLPGLLFGAFAGAAYLGLYTSTKAALWNLTRTMAKEWGPLGVRVNAIAPGPFDTDMMAPTLGMADFHDQIVDSTIMKRIAEPVEVVGPVIDRASVDRG